MQQTHFDIVIVGGGMVGSALANGLAQQEFQVAILECEVLTDFNPHSPPDIRTSSINYASVVLLKELGVWKNVKQMRCAPYRKLETWEWKIAQVQFDAASLGLAELGYMVENSVLKQALWQRLREQGVKCFIPVKLQNMQRHKNNWHLTLTNGQHLTAKLVIGADGTNSKVRKLAGINIQGWNYKQSCMLICIELDHDSGDTTWQYFTPDGPRAMLPLYGKWASLVWYDNPVRIHYLQSLSPNQLKKEVEKCFPTRLGYFRIQYSTSFPLVHCHATNYVFPGLALVGDAAHTIHPMAGQGVNLGYRDINTLIKVLITARNQTELWNSERILLHYQRQRKKDNLLMQNGINLLCFAFSNRIPLLILLRNVAMMIAEHSGILKHQVLKYALGIL